MNCVIIECFGTPGVGKTFISQKIASRLRESGFRVSDRAIRLSESSFYVRVALKTSMILHGVLLDTKFIFAITPIILSHKPRGLIKPIKLLYNWFFLIGLIKHEVSNNDFIILDQGLGQAYWSTLFHGQRWPDSNGPLKLFELILQGITSASLQIVHIKASEACIRRRLDDRTMGKSPLDEDQNSNWARAVEVSTRARAFLNLVSEMYNDVKITDCYNDANDSFSSDFEKEINLIVTELIWSQ